MKRNKYFKELFMYNILALIIIFVLTRFLKIPFRWWITIATTSSAYIVYRWLDKENH